MEESDSTAGSWSSEQSFDRAQLSEDEVEDDGFSQLVCEPLNSFPGRDKAAVVRRSLVPRHKPTRQFLRSSLPTVLSEEPRYDSDDNCDDGTSVKKVGTPQTEHDHLAQARGDETKPELPVKDRGLSHVEASSPARALHPGKIPGGLGLVAAGVAAAAASRTTSSPQGHEHARTTAMDTGAGADTAGIATVGSRKQRTEKEEEVSRPPVIPEKALGFKLPPIVPRKPAVAVSKPQPDAPAAAAVAAGAGHEVSTTAASAAAAADASAVADSSARVLLRRDQAPAPPAKPPRPPPPMSARVEAQQSPAASPKVPPRLKPVHKVPAVAHAAATAVEPAGGDESWVSEEKKLAASADPAAEVGRMEQLLTAPAARRQPAEDPAEDRSAPRIHEPHAGNHFGVVQHQRQHSDLRIEAREDDEGERLSRHLLPSDACHDAAAATATGSTPVQRQQLTQCSEPAADGGMLAFARSVLRSSTGRAHSPRTAAETAGTANASAAGITRAATVAAAHSGVHLEVVQHSRQHSDVQIAASEGDEGERLTRRLLPPDACHDAEATTAVSSSPAQRQQLVPHSEPAADGGMLAFARSALRSSASRAHPPPQAAAEAAGTAYGSAAGVKRAATVAAADSGDPAFSGITLKTMKLDAKHPEAGLEAGDGGTSSSTAAAAAASAALHSGSLLAADCTSGVAVSESAKMVDAEDHWPKSTAAAAVTDSAEGIAKAVRQKNTSSSSEPAPRVTSKPQPRPCPPQKPALKTLPQQQQQPLATFTKHDGAASAVKPAPGAPSLAAAATAVGSAAANAAAGGSRPTPGANGNARHPGAQPIDILPAAGHGVFASAKVSPSASDSMPASVSGTGGRTEIARVVPQPRVDHERPHAASSRSDSSNGSDDGTGRAADPSMQPQQLQQPPAAPVVRLRRKSPPPQPSTREGPDGPAADLPLPPNRLVSVQRRHTHAAYDVAAKSTGTPVAEPVWVQMAAERARRNSVISEPEPTQKTPTPPSLLEQKPVPASNLHAAIPLTAGTAGSGSSSRPLASLAAGRVVMERQSAFASSTAPAFMLPSKAPRPVVSPRAGQSTAHDLAVTSRDLPAVIAQRRPSRELAATVGQQNDENKPPSPAAMTGQGSPRGGSLNKDPDGHLVISNMSPSASQPLGERCLSVDSLSAAAAGATFGKQQPSPRQANATTVASAGVELSSAEEQGDVKLRPGRTAGGHQDKRHFSVAVGALPAGDDVPLKSQAGHNGAADRIGLVSKDKADAGTPTQEPEFMKRVRERKARLRESGISVGDDE